MVARLTAREKMKDLLRREMAENNLDCAVYCVQRSFSEGRMLMAELIVELIEDGFFNKETDDAKRTDVGCTGSGGDGCNDRREV